MISLSILKYEPDLHIDRIEDSKALSQILKLIQTGKVHDVHIDVMRLPMIPNQTRFPIPLIKNLYEALNTKILLVLHLMVKDPFPIIKQINKFVPFEKRGNMTIIMQLESFSTEDATIKALNRLCEYGYRMGICIDLPTRWETLTDNIIENADIILIMSVPMGLGGQKFSDEAIIRIMAVSRRFPGKIIEVDGGINVKTIVKTREAGAKVAVIGSFITLSEDPEKAILQIEESLRET